MWLAGSVAGLVLASGCGEQPSSGGPDDAGVTDAGTTDAGTTDAGTQDAGTPDTDLALARFNADGTLDTSFGTDGIAWLDLGPGSSTVRDSMWSMDRDSQDRLVLFGSKKADGDRADADRVVVRLTANGALDTSFATGGIHTLDTQNVGDNARNGFVQADGKIVASGYASVPTGAGTQNSNAIVLLRLNDDGTPDTTFGTEGVVVSNPFQPADPVNTPWGMAEAYSAGRQSTGAYVTTGYGRAAATGPVDVVSFRYDAAGAPDSTWGTMGGFLYDAIGDHDRGRNMTVLSDDRVFMVGSSTTAAGQVDAMVLMLTADGALDETFGTGGVSTHAFGRKDQALFGVASTQDWVAAVGYRGAEGSEDADSILLLQPLGGTGNAFVNTVPLSDANEDRLWAVTFDANGKAVAAGIITENGDSRMVVARFNTDGSLDTTFGSGGVAQVNAAEAGTLEAARAVVVQSDGKIVIAGAAEVAK
ncbi:MAG: hypothetical protein WBV82_16545 [Myxococcaceae bacterium]